MMGGCIGAIIDPVPFALALRVVRCGAAYDKNVSFQAIFDKAANVAVCITI